MRILLFSLLFVSSCNIPAFRQMPNVGIVGERTISIAPGKSRRIAEHTFPQNDAFIGRVSYKFAKAGREGGWVWASPAIDATGNPLPDPAPTEILKTFPFCWMTLDGKPIDRLGGATPNGQGILTFFLYIDIRGRNVGLTCNVDATESGTFGVYVSGLSLSDDSRTSEHHYTLGTVYTTININIATPTTDPTPLP